MNMNFITQSIENIPEAYFIVDVKLDIHGQANDLVFQYVNKAYEKMHHVLREDVIGKSFFDVFDKVPQKRIDFYKKVAYEGISQEVELYKDEIGKFLTVSAFCLKKGVCGCVLKEKKDYIDSLIGCLNFDGFKAHAKQILSEYQQKTYAFWSVDIKQFKYYNEKHGYKKGDLFLQKIGKLFMSHLQKDEIIGRVRADHFIFLTQYDKFLSLNESITPLMKSLEQSIDQSFQVKLVGGVYVRYPSLEDININKYLDYAELARKKAKSSKTKQIEFFDEELWTKETRAIEISQHLDEALKNGEIEAWFQPQYDYYEGKIIGAEVLSRWTHSIYGRLFPDEFIRVLEETGQISQLDYYIWDQACQCMRKWLDQGKKMPLSINISRKDTLAEGLLTELIGLTDKYQLERKMLRVEITESAYMDEPDILIQLVHDLKEAGFHVEMDDFGSGYSSLNMLKDVPVSTIKLDLRFLTNIENNSKAGNIISSVIRMAHGMNMGVIAEGVETKQQADFLKNLGCHMMQGYYFAKPLNRADFEDHMTQCVLGDVKEQFNEENMKNIQELLTSHNNSSFIFNRCVGAAAILEYTNLAIKIVLANDKFFEMNGGFTQDVPFFQKNDNIKFSKEDTKKLQKTIQKAIIHQEAKCQAFMKPTSKWVELRYYLISKGLSSTLVFCQMEDVTKEVLLKKELQEVQANIEWQQKKFEALAHMPGVITYDYNPKTDDLNLDYSNQDGIQKRIVEKHFLRDIEHLHWIASESAQAHKMAYQEAMRKQTTGFIDFLGCFEGEDYLWYRSHYTSVVDENGEVYRIVGRADLIDTEKNAMLKLRYQSDKDAQKIKKLQEQSAIDTKKIVQLQKKASCDAMTGLLNYQNAIQFINQYLQLDHKGTLLMIDIDNFKAINDVYGHLYGNKMLKSFSHALTMHLREDDVIGRFGGDEFIVFMPSVTDCQMVSSIISRIIATTNNIKMQEAQHLCISVGAVVNENSEMLVEEMVKYADKAMYESKTKGKNTFTIIQH